MNVSSGITSIAFPEILAYAMTKGAIVAFLASADSGWVTVRIIDATGGTQS